MNVRLLIPGVIIMIQSLVQYSLYFFGVHCGQLFGRKKLRYRHFHPARPFIQTILGAG
jgi:hypothetical protein